MSNKEQKLEQTKKHKMMLRNKTIISSSKEVSVNGINLKEEILNILKEEGFNIEEEGTKYLASLIALLFHERKLYQKLHNRESYKDYWNVADEKNEHYQMLGTKASKVLKAIKESLASSAKENALLSSFVYDITDKIVQNYDNDQEIVEYKKILRK